MRNICFAAIATLVVAFGNMAIVGAARADSSSHVAPLTLDDWGRDALGGA